MTQALELAPDDVRVHYMAAVVHALSGNLRAASLAARRALALGYPKVLIATDPLLASAQPAQRLATDRFTALFGPIAPANPPIRLPAY
jgi:hypothetical protein